VRIRLKQHSKPIKDTEVRIKIDGDREIKKCTDSNGKIRINGLAPGAHSVTIIVNNSRKEIYINNKIGIKKADVIL
jgi:hypothetical protein